MKHKNDTMSDDVKCERSSDQNLDSICRDFARGTCDRKFCKYKHETEVRSLNFCYDFQNATCPRPNCKFIHCTTEEVEEYKKTGDMSNQILAEASRKNQLPGIQPVCNLFRKGNCRRPLCKYRHITKEKEEAEIMELIRNNSNHRNQFQFNNNFPETHLNHFMTVPDIVRPTRITFDENEYEPLAKRRFCSRTDFTEASILPPDFLRKKAAFRGYFAANPPPMLGHIDARTIMLEEENSLLHKEVVQLKRQVSDLTATNEFLLDQNANLRVSSKRNGTVTVPAVTLTSSLTQNTPPQVIRTVAASVATVPVSLATVTTCNPVSGNSVSITGCPSVSIAQPTQILAPSQQILVTTNQSTQLALASSSQAQLAIAQQNLANNLAQQAQQAQPQLTSQAQQLALATTTQQLTSQAQHMATQQLALASAPQQLTTQSQQLAMANSNQQMALATTQQAQQLANQQLTSQAQQLANQQLTSQAQQLANQQLTSQARQLANQQLTSQAQQLANQQLTSQAQQLANQQLTSQAQQLANQQLTSQAQQLANQQLTSQAQQLANQQLTSQAQQLANQQLTSQAQQLANQQLTSQAQLALANTLANNTLTSQAQQLALANTPQQLTVANVPQQLALASASQQLEMHRNNQMNAINTSQAIAMSNATQPMVSYPIMTQSINHALTH